MRFLAMAIFVSVGLLVAAPASKKKTPTRKTPAKAAAKSRRTNGYMKGQSLPGQRVPTPERYREIEEALASRGYLEKSPDGAWDPRSIAALKKFQQDQNLDPSGRLTSLSLIALGLGPKRDGPASPAP